MEEGLGFNSEIIANVRFILTTGAWFDYLVPSLKSMRESWVSSLIDPSSGRKERESDDYIRGCIATIDAFLSLPQSLVDEADARNALQEKIKAEADRYSDRANLGTP